MTITTRKSPKDVGAIIMKRMLMQGPEDMGAEHDMGDDEEGEGENLRLIAGDIMDAFDDKDQDAFADALEAFVKSC